MNLDLVVLAADKSIEETLRVREWVQKQGWWQEGQVKPLAPKEGYEAALREVRKPKSSSNFRSLAERVSIARCRDSSFLRLLEILRGWFPRRVLS